MSAAAATVALPEPFFLTGSRGRLLCTYFGPQAERRGALLYVPPFAEEMNRCRATVAEQARRLASAGHDVLLLDPYGTGDSEGDFSEASWQTWLGDVTAAGAWLEERSGGPIGLWGCRTGALLAADAAQSAPGRYRRLLFWQPVLDGKMFLTQYLRLRVAFLMDRGLPAETTNEMRQTLQAGGTLESAGYGLTGQLAAELDDKRLLDMDALTDMDVTWCELVSEQGAALAMPSQKGIAFLEGQGCRVDVRPFTGPPIWQLHRRDELPDLISTTLTALGEGA